MTRFTLDLKTKTRMPTPKVCLKNSEIEDVQGKWSIIGKIYQFYSETRSSANADGTVRAHSELI